MQVLKDVRRIELRTKHLVEGLLQGAYHSVFKGRGIEFSEVREYVPGDDVRTIDWNVTARMDEPYVKEFIEERDLTLNIVFDISASGNFGHSKSKKQAAIELAASLMFAAIRNNDNAGLCLFSDSIESYTSPRKGKKHVFKLIRDLLHTEPASRGTDLSGALRFMSKVSKKRSILFIISDFVSEDFRRELRILSSRHDVIGVDVHDAVEDMLPDIGYIEVEDEETGEEMIVNTSDPGFRQRYSRLMQRRKEDLEKIFRRTDADLISVRTDEPFELPLRRFFRLRERRIR